jgi:hypothetical protein
MDNAFEALRVRLGDAVTIPDVALALVHTRMVAEGMRFDFGAVTACIARAVARAGADAPADAVWLRVVDALVDEGLASDRLRPLAPLCTSPVVVIPAFQPRRPTHDAANASADTVTLSEADARPPRGRTYGFTLSPFGRGASWELIHSGSLFDVYDAELEGRRVCVKTPAAAPRRVLGCRWSALYDTETFISGETGPYALSGNAEEAEALARVVANLLAVEAQVLRWAGPSWNHEPLGIGVWDGAAEWGPKPTWHLDMRLALVLPRHDAAPLSTLAPEERRALVPRMLPVLWDALCRAYHGDLSETNLLVARDRSRFHLIDPGVIAAASFSSVKEGEYFGSARTSAVFTTTRASYPLLPPFEDARLFPDEAHEDAALDLAACLRAMLPHSWDGPDLRIMRVDARATHASGAPAPRRRPFPSDLLALGLLYVRALTGETLFLEPAFGLDRAAWEGELPSFGRAGYSRANSVYDQFARALGRVEAGYIHDRLAALPLTAGQRRLAEALLNLRVRTRGELAGLLAEGG